MELAVLRATNVVGDLAAEIAEIATVLVAKVAGTSALRKK